MSHFLTMYFSILFISCLFEFRWTYADSSWARIAALVPLVVTCAEAGDQIADEILNHAVQDLALSVKAVVQRLHLAGEGVSSFIYTSNAYETIILSQSMTGMDITCSSCRNLRLLLDHSCLAYLLITLIFNLSPFN